MLLPTRNQQELLGCVAAVFGAGIWRFRWWSRRLLAPLEEVFEPGTATLKAGWFSVRLSGRFQGRKAGIEIDMADRNSSPPKRTSFTLECRSPIEFRGRTRNGWGTEGGQWNWDLGTGPAYDDTLASLTNAVDIENRLARLGQHGEGSVSLGECELEYVRRSAAIWKLPVESVRQVYAAMAGIGSEIEHYLPTADRTLTQPA